MFVGNCWFMAGAACVVASNKRLFQRVVPSDQGFDSGYAGIVIVFFVVTFDSGQEM